MKTGLNISEELAFAITWDEGLTTGPVLSLKAKSDETRLVRSTARRYGVKVVSDASACKELLNVEESLEVPESCYRTIARLFILGSSRK